MAPGAAIARSGLGRALLRESLQRLRAAGIERAMLGVDSLNPSGALPFYERVGFERTRTVIAYNKQVQA
ncbi:MAG: GNAT family N-acetyltransferase [Chloroflexaceae bacterium]|nr:GNAT family N-acetyltransferase [Chloroflexaceae bacterium]